MNDATPSVPPKEGPSVGLLPRPLLSLMVATTWLLANNTLYVGHILLAVGLGIGLPRLTVGFWPNAPRLRKPVVALRLLAVFAYDVLVANFQVARLVLGPNEKLHPAFIHVPLDLKDEFGVALLASLVTLTPGTVSVDYDPKASVLHVHALNVDDAEGLVKEIKQRYETPLREALGC